MIARVEPAQRRRAKRLRANQTEPEAVLWQAIRAKRLEGIKFRRQVPMGPFIVDFFCPEHRLVIELDGSQHGEPDTAEYDARRTAWLRDRGYRVVRFWNDDVLRDLDGVCRHILAECGVLERAARGISDGQ